MKTRHEEGFTLIELLVVLAILAALSTVALRSVSGLQDRARFEATTHRLEDIEAALLGTRSGLPGDVRAGGLLADTGRFLSESVPEPVRFADLVRIPLGVPVNQLVSAIGDSDVRLAVGWRGPYLRTATGAEFSEQIEDGWGNPIAAVLNGTTWSLVSPGADNVFGPGSGYDADVAIVLPAGAANAIVAGHVLIPESVGMPATPTISVFAYEPNPNATSAQNAILPVESEPITYTPPAAGPPTTRSFPFQISSALLTPGPRVLRAYVHDAGVDAPTHKSRVLSVHLLHGSQNLDITIEP